MKIVLQHPCFRRFFFYQEVLSFKTKVWNYRRQLSEAVPHIFSFMLLNNVIFFPVVRFWHLSNSNSTEKQIKLNHLGIKIRVLFKSTALLSIRPPCVQLWECSVGSRHLYLNFYAYNPFLIIVTCRIAESIDHKTCPLTQVWVVLVCCFFWKRQFCVPKAH